MIPRNVIRQLYDNYVNTCRLLGPYSKIRRPVFPEVISEHLVLFILENNGCRNLHWQPSKNDILHNNSSIEVKCSSSTGPLSFGPTQNWDELYILDCSDFLRDNMKCYRFSVSHAEFGKIRVSKTETFAEQCTQKRRPRVALKKILEQLPGKYDVIYSGSIIELLK